MHLLLLNPPMRLKALYEGFLGGDGTFNQQGLGVQVKFKELHVLIAGCPCKPWIVSAVYHISLARKLSCVSSTCNFAH